MILRVIERHVGRRTGHGRACRCRRCAAWRVRLKRAARLRGILPGAPRVVLRGAATPVSC